MKSEYAARFFVALALGVPSLVGAAEPASPTAASQAERANTAAANYMQRLLAMSDEQLVRSRQVLEKVEKLSHEERAALRKKLQDVREAPVAEREKVVAEVQFRLGLASDEFRGGREARPAQPAKESAATPTPRPATERTPQEVERRNAFRSLLDKHWATMSPEDARKDRERFVAMTREQRLEYAKQLREKYGLPPEPERRRGNANEARPERNAAPAPAAK